MIIRKIQTRPAAWLVNLAALAALAGCSAVPMTSSQTEVAQQEVIPGASADQAATPAAENAAALTIPISTPRSPQLVKHATLRIELDNIDQSLKTISTILSQYQGDLLQLSDEEHQAGTPRAIHISLRVPQENLDAALEDLRALGRVANQSLAAEDVSTQLVDLQARLRNLRQSEAALLEIMKRSGSIADVLAVNQELSAVREAIERQDAQLKALQNQVAYSTIALTLVSSGPATPAAGIGETLGQTWQTASHAMRGLSVGLLQLLLWLLVFSPYLGVIVVASWAGRRYWKSHRPSSEG